jgi:surfactin synthase thioesterase subunit/acyl carrier protein
MTFDEQAAAVLALVRGEVARVLSGGISPEASLDQSLGEVGLSSLGALELRSALARRAGVAIPASLELEQSTYATLAKHILAELVAGRAPRPVSQGAVARCSRLAEVSVPRMRLFCFHDAGGTEALFAPFGALGAGGVEIHTVAHQRSLPASKARAREYLATVVAYVRSLPSAPFALFGHSLGALFAWRVMQELLLDGGPLPELYIPSALPPVVDQARASAVDIARLARLAIGEQAFTNGQLGSFERDVESDVLLWQAMPNDEAYCLATPIVAFLGREDALVSETAMLAWERFTSDDFAMTILPGGHSYPYRAESRRLLLDELGTRLSTPTGIPFRSAAPGIRRRSTTTLW